MFCPNCGAELPENAKFCNKCGANLSSQNKDNGNVSADIVPKETVQKQNNTVENADAVQNQMLKSKFDSMSTMLIVSIVFYFIFFPVFFILYIVILVKSKDLVESANIFFKKYKAADYVLLTDKVAGEIHRQKLALVGIILISILALIGSIAAAFNGNDLASLLVLFSCALIGLSSILSLYLAVSQIFTLCRFFQVNSAIQALSLDQNAVLSKPSNMLSWIITGVMLAFVIISIFSVIGIVAGISLPAYAKYMAEARFAEVTTAATSIQKQVELCVFDTTNSDFEPNSQIIAPKCSNNETGNGWQISSPENYATKYITKAEVENGVIKITAVNAVGLKGATLIMVPYSTDVNNGTVNWKIDESSTCIQYDLCK